jgi:hypothetical protein
LCVDLLIGVSPVASLSFVPFFCPFPLVALALFLALLLMTLMGLFPLPLVTFGALSLILYLR